jgi:hypothetical protein
MTSRTPVDAATITQRAADAGVAVRYLGTRRLFPDIRLYAGWRSDWLVAPADVHRLATGRDLILPRAQLRALWRLVHAGLNAPVVYVAHELEQGRIGDPRGGAGHRRAVPGTFRSLDAATARRAIGPPALPPRTTVLSSHLGRVADALLSLLGRRSMPPASAGHTPGARTPWSTPTGLPPRQVVLGAWTAGGPVAGDAPAAWFELACDRGDP